MTQPKEPAPTGDRFERAARAVAALARTMGTLRRQCPWDRAQTHQSLRSYLMEETFEALEALDAGAPAAVCEELGDVLFQVVFHAEIAQERGDFDLAQVAEGIDSKLVRRHPHVFAEDPMAEDPDLAEGSGGEHPSWEELKAQEKPHRQSALDGVPVALPALLRAYRVGEKAAKVGFDWPQADPVVDKIREELQELEEERRRDPIDREALTEELGDLLFSVVNLARHLDVDPEAALRGTIRKFDRRFRFMEKALRAKGQAVDDCTLDQLEALWKYASAHEG